MRYFTLLALGLYGLTAHAGGIGFQSRYVGTNPATGSQIVMQFATEDYSLEQTGISLSGGPFNNHTNLVVNGVSRNFPFDANYEVKKHGENGDLIAKIVTTGNCQLVESFALVFPTGDSSMAAVTLTAVRPATTHKQ